MEEHSFWKLEPGKNTSKRHVYLSGIQKFRWPLALGPGRTSSNLRTPSSHYRWHLKHITYIQSNVITPLVEDLNHKVSLTFLVRIKKNDYFFQNGLMSISQNSCLIETFVQMCFAKDVSGMACAVLHCYGPSWYSLQVFWRQILTKAKWSQEFKDPGLWLLLHHTTPSFILSTNKWFP
jgi:hypothetical protein